MKNAKSLYHGHRFPAAVISCAVRWYFRFQLSLRDIEDLLFERGVISWSASNDSRPSIKEGSSFGLSTCIESSQRLLVVLGLFSFGTIGDFSSLLQLQGKRPGYLLQT
jgi:hypothetical protein